MNLFTCLTWITENMGPRKQLQTKRKTPKSRRWKTFKALEWNVWNNSYMNLVKSWFLLRNRLLKQGCSPCRRGQKYPKCWDGRRSYISKNVNKFLVLFQVVSEKKTFKHYKILYMCMAQGQGQINSRWHILIVTNTFYYFNHTWQGLAISL